MPMRLLWNRGVALLVGVAVSVSVHDARAEEDACIAAYEQTQTLRKDGKILEANENAAICARESCPAILAKDCSRWHAELDASTPSVVFEARSPSGSELTSVRVSVDGTPLVDRLDGKAVAVDPGKRTFRFVAEGADPVEQELLVREGEKNRKISVELAAEAPPSPVSRPVPLGVWLFGGATVAALAVTTVFTIDGLARKSDLDACRPSCAPADVDAMSASFTVADVALGAAAMSGLATLYLYLTRPTVEEERAGVLRPRPYAAPTTGGAALGVVGRF
jgi:hypothetical protein